MRGSRDLRIRRAAISCGFDRDQLVLYIVQLHQPGMHRAVFEVKRCCLKNVGAKFSPCLRFSEDGMAESAGAIAAFLSVTNFEDYLHAHRIPEAGVDGAAACGPTAPP